MTLPKPEAGLVISYSYLWRHEYLTGQQDGRKDRPCVIILAIEAAGDETRVAVVPVTHRQPQQLTEALELPAAVKRQLRLDQDPSWVILSEMNLFTWPGPDLRPVPEPSGTSFAYGFLPPRLFAELKRRFLALTGPQARIVPRTE